MTVTLYVYGCIQTNRIIIIKSARERGRERERGTLNTNTLRPRYPAGRIPKREKAGFIYRPAVRSPGIRPNPGIRPKHMAGYRGLRVHTTAFIHSFFTIHR